MVIWVYIAAFLLMLGITYHFGRQSGIREGRKAAYVEVPIQLRMTLQLEQRCPICDDEKGFPIQKQQKQG